MRLRGVLRRTGRPAIMVGAVLGLGCGTSDGVSPPVAPEISAAFVAENPRNALSLVVTVEAEADSLLVRFGGRDDRLDGATPAVVPEASRALIPVLGLLGDTRYVLRVVAYRAGDALESDLLVASTGSLPSDLPRFEASGSDPSPGYVVFAAGRYGLAIDHTGRVVWYRAFPDGPGLNFQAQPSGRYAARPRPPDPATSARWIEVDPLGNETRSFGCARGLEPRFHDIIVGSAGDYWIMCDETRVEDLSGVGGSANAGVTGTVVQHLSAAGVLLFEWSPFDHFQITDLEPESLLGPAVNWTHGNALDLDTDGNLIVSFRSLNEVTKIDVGTGHVIWRMGGLRNQFSLVGSPTPPFARQHGVRVTGPGELTLLDNSGDALASRVERFAYDAQAWTARLVASYGPETPVTARLGGTTQELPGGRTLVAFGDGGRVQEYDSTGKVVWQLDGDPGYVFRAERIASLYDPGRGMVQ